MIILNQDIIDGLLSRRRIHGDNLEIKCEKTQAVPYKDILELYLLCSGVSKWTWLDSDGSSSDRQTLTSILYNLVRDMWAWPYIYVSRAHAVRNLRTRLLKSGTLQQISTVLYLRTDHWFNIKSGGSVGHVSGVIRGLRTLGLTAHIVSTDCLSGLDNDDHFHLHEPRYDLGRNIPNIPELVYNDRVRTYIEEQWSKWTPSIIYQRYSLGNYVGALLKASHGVPFVCEYNGSFPWVARHWEKRKLFHEKLLTDIEFLNLHAADLIVVVSMPLKDELVSRGIAASKILVNPNGVDPDRYSPGVDGSRVRGRFHLNGKTVIGFIGTFGKWHGAEVLAEAFGLLLKEHPEYRNSVRLFMIGDGITMPQVKETMEKYAVGDACILTGRIPQEVGPVHLAACDILASPHVPNPDGTPFFGSPTKLFEYMAMGKGIVASDLDQIGEILKHGKTAWMVKPGDPESLMLGLKKLIDDAPLRKKLGKAARDEVVAKYTWKEHTRKIIARLREVLGENHGQ